VRRLEEIPHYLRIVDSNAAVAATVIEVAEMRSFRSLQYVFGTTGRDLIGGDLLIDTASVGSVSADGMREASVAEAARIAAKTDAAGADLIVGCGGGRVLDVAKHAAFQSGKPFLSVPTQATHDGICSPVAVLRNESGHVESLGAVAPIGIVVPAHVVATAPRACLVSGIADLVSNVLAVADWRWASEFAGEAFDDYAALLAETGAQLLLARRSAFAPDRAFSREDVELIVRGLVLSGLAMTLAGTTRPCSGSEHLLSHAFDALGAGDGTHGEQVAVGCSLAALMYNESPDVAAVLELLRAVGAPLRPADIGISRDDARRALALAPTVRPDRLTRLTRALEVDGAYVERLAEVAWG
jgi:glycerol-1-phosphate dehydrogenase [NAD(P)+]